MQIPDGNLHFLKDEEYLKKQYLKLAKVYHPDA
jgi:curved DNA-binding protein CbpA